MLLEAADRQDCCLRLADPFVSGSADGYEMAHGFVLPSGLRADGRALAPLDGCQRALGDCTPTRADRGCAQSLSAERWRGLQQQLRRLARRRAARQRLWPGVPGTNRGRGLESLV